MTLKMCKHANYACEHDKLGICTWAVPGITADCKYDEVGVMAAPLPTAIGPATALDVQIGGDHYKDFEIQPAEFITKNRIGFLEGCVIKRMCRWEAKNGREDLEKAKHEIDLLIELRAAK